MTTTPSTNAVNALARRGIKLLLGRQFFIQIFTFVGGVILARVLNPAEFGVFAVVTFIVSVLGLLGDFGLASSFIQRKTEFSERELQVAFTLQQIFTTTVFVVLFFLSPWIVSLYPNMSQDMVWLIRACALSLYLTAWRSMSALQLERKLSYDRLAWVEILEIVSYQLFAVTLACLGYGVWSFITALLVRGALGSIVLYVLAPWPIRLCFDWPIAKEILRFGLPFQFTAIVNGASNWITPTLVMSLIGNQAVGFLGWASANGRKPLLLVDNFTRVSFPHFSRIQDDPVEVERLLVRYLSYLLAISGFWFIMLAVAGSSLVELIYTKKWLPAVPALILYGVALGLDVTSSIVSTVLISSGKIILTAKSTTLRTVCNISISVWLVLWIGFMGIPIAYIASILIAMPVLFLGLGKGSFRRIMAQLAWILIPLFGSGIVGFSLLILKLPLLLMCIVLLAALILTYAILVWLACPEGFRTSMAYRLNGLRKSVSLAT